MGDEDYPVLLFENILAWATWLDENQGSSKGIWLKLSKKGNPTPSISYDQALDTALCYGWIDGLKRAFDDQFWLQKFTPRGPKSGWSKINVGKAELLIAAGKMQPAGLSQVELAKADGRWESAYDPQSKIGVPDDFQRELDQNPTAMAFFNELNSANRYAILYRIQTAKKPETRSARIAKFVEMLASRQKLHP